MAPVAHDLAERTPAELATDRALDAELDAAISGSDRLPDGTTFVAADMASLGRVLDRHLGAGQTVVLVYADGHRRVLHPMRPFASRVAWAARRLRAGLRARGAR